MSDDKKNPQEIFFQAVEIESAQEQQAFLQSACEGDDELRAKVDRLIRAYHAAGSFLEQPIAKIAEENPSESWKAANVAQDVTTDSGNTGEKPTDIGPYKVLQQIGEGGMGSVFMAQQENPVKRRVALKVIKAGMDTKQVIARFEAERQALALMDHPNIARLLDVGATETGRPYFVMELVNGIPITEYCDQKRLNVTERLELFILVCQAVQHAHQKGIIHRDLKPNNILITEYDEKVVPKIIDFGLAKALGQNLTDKTVFTQFGQVMGTLAYMSPEQSRVNALDIDTRADVYSLGVLMYELLTGSTPFEEKTFREAAFDQVLKIIREETPQKPSTRLSSGGTDTQTAPNRNTDPAKLGRLVRGDLDWIVMKALEKDRSRRYETANAFSDDINRFLNDDAVIARPPTTGYKLSKFVKKNRGLVAALTLVASSLFAGIVGTSVGWFNTQEAKKLADKKTRLAEQKTVEADQARNRAAAEASSAQRARDIAVASDEKSAAALARTNYYLANAKWDAGQVLDAHIHLDKIPPKDRHFEWHFAKRKFIGSDITFYGFATSQNGVKFSVDGKQIVSESLGKKINVWDASTGQELADGQIDQKLETFEMRRRLGAAYSFDGTRIAIPLGRLIEVRDATTNRKLKTLVGHFDDVTLACFSPDGTRIATASKDNSIKVWNAMTGQVLRTLKGHYTGITSLSFSPEGARLVSADKDETIKIWSLKSNQESVLISGQGEFLGHLSFSPDSSRIATANKDHTIKIWDAGTGQELQGLTGNTSSVTSFDFSSNGKQIVTAHVDKTIGIWNAETGRKLSSFRGDASSRLFGRNHIGSVRFSPDASQVTSICFDQGIMLKTWDAMSGIEVNTYPKLELAEKIDWPRILRVAPDRKRIVSGGLLGGVKVWDAATGQKLMTLSGHASAVDAMEYSPDGTKFASGTIHGQIKIWNSETGRELITLAGHGKPVYTLSFSPDGKRIVSAAADKLIKIWDSMTGDLLCTLSGHSTSIGHVCFSPDGNRLATSSVNEVMIWDATPSQEVRTLTGHTDRVMGLSFSPDDQRLASGSFDCSVKIWNTASGQELLTLADHQFWVMQVGFGPDGSQIATKTMGKSKIKIWDATTGQELHVEEGRRLPERFRRGGRLLLSDDGRWMAKVFGHKNILLVDRHCTDNPGARAHAAGISELDPIWHQRMAEAAMRSENWFAETFHRAWVIKADPYAASAYDQLHAANNKFLKAMSDQEQKTFPHSHSIVTEMLLLPKGNK